MLHIKLHITYDRRVLSLLAGLGLALLLSASGQWLPSSQHAAASPATDFVPMRTGRHVYLTAAANIPPPSAPAACASGYHMASLWEIMDLSNLTYDYDHPSAATRDDSGHGPPSYLGGWVRTGYDNSASNTAGTGNCNNWTVTNITDYGTAAHLSHEWATVSGQTGLWEVAAYSCALTGRVWCVRDNYTIFLPLTMRSQ